MDYNPSKKLKKSNSMETLYNSEELLFEHLEFNLEGSNKLKNKLNLERNNKLNDEFIDVINNLNEVKIDYSCKDILLDILKKINFINKKIEYIDKFNSSLEELNNKINKYISEKDYIIESLKEENLFLNNEIKDLNNIKKNSDIKINDYFY